MKLETFFEKFDQFADAPDAVAKMRELVLELSATGRLIPEVLKQPIEVDTKAMGSIVELVMGQAPAGDECNTEGRGTVFVKVGEFGPLYPREEVWTTNPLKFAKKGDVLVCVVGATVGKLNLAIDCAIGRSAAAIRPSAALDTKFLYYSLMPYTLRLRRNSRGSAQGVIGKVELNAVSLWVPSREVQKRIVAKVDELMTLCDRLEAQQQEREQQHAALARASLARFAEAPTPENLQFIFHKSYDITPADLRKSILTLAVQGKLVPQDPNDEPVDTDSQCEALFDIPSKWRWKPLGRLGLCRTGKTPPTGNPKNYGFGFSFIGPGQITLSGRFTTSEKSITRQGLESSTEASAGDILMVCIGGSIGKAAICREPVGFNQQINSVRLQRDLPEFIYLAFTADYFQELVLANASGSATPIINKGKWEQIPIPLPPLAEQRRIVAKVDQLMALVDELETQLAASRTTAKNLLDALVAELTA